MSAIPGGMRRLLFVLVGVFGKWILAIYYATIHIVDDPAVKHEFNRTPQPSGIYPFWHAQQLSIAWHCRRTKSAILVSRSADGEYIARIADALGYSPVRGSSSRGAAVGLKGLLHHAIQGRPVAVTPDGPRGPRHSIKTGMMWLAQKSGCRITPAALGLSRYWEIPSWDRFRIPKPFSRGYFCWGEPLIVPPDADDELIERLKQELQERMVALEEYADQVAKSLS